MPTPTTAGARCRGLRAHLAALVAAALLPAFAVGAIAVGAAVGSYRQAFDDRLEGTARALASAVGTEIGAHVIALSTLAASRGFDPGGDVQSVHRPARDVADALGTRIFVVAPDLGLVLHTHFPPGTPSSGQPPRESGEVARRAFETGRPAVGDLLQGTVTGRAVAPVYVPVLREGRVAYAIGAALESERLSRMLAEQTFRGGGYASVVDGRGRIVARSAEPERFVGQPVRGWVTEGVRGGESGLLRGPNRADVEIVTAFRRVPRAPGWFVTVAEPLSGYRASLRGPLAALALGGLGTLAAALAAAVGIGGRILGPVDWLARKAERVAASGGTAEIMPEGPPVRVREFGRLRAAVLRAHVTLRERASAMAAGEARLRAVVDTASDAIVVIDERGVVQSFNRAAEAIFGYASAEAVGRNVSLLMPGEVAARHDGYLAAYLRTGERRIIGIGREVEGRRKDGTAVPLDLSIAEWRDAEGTRFFTGIMRDISARKADEARRTLLAREVDHRAKNALAVVQSVLRLTPRHEPGTFASAVEARVAALARVHSLLAEGGWSGADLRAVAEGELAPYASAHPRQATAVSLDGPPAALAPTAVQPLAMVLHELATNAAKHGALSAPGGRVEVRWRACRGVGEDGLLHLRWAESGGPPVQGAPARRGFGSRVVEATVRGQLGGSLDWRWAPSGLVVEVAVPLARVVADGGTGGAANASAAVGARDRGSQ